MAYKDEYSKLLHQLSLEDQLIYAGRPFIPASLDESFDRSTESLGKLMGFSSTHALRLTANRLIKLGLIYKRTRRTTRSAKTRTGPKTSTTYHLTASGEDRRKEIIAHINKHLANPMPILLADPTN